MLFMNKRLSCNFSCKLTPEFSPLFGFPGKTTKNYYIAYREHLSTNLVGEVSITKGLKLEGLSNVLYSFVHMKIESRTPSL